MEDEISNPIFLSRYLMTILLLDKIIFLYESKNITANKPTLKIKKTTVIFTHLQQPHVPKHS